MTDNSVSVFRPSKPGIEVSAPVWMRAFRTQSPFSMITVSSITDHTKEGFIKDVLADEDKVQETTFKACEREESASLISTT